MEHSLPHTAFKGRAGARMAAVQALYQIEMLSGEVEDIIEEFITSRLENRFEHHFGNIDRTLFMQLVQGVCAYKASLDESISGVLSEQWRLERLESVMRALMRAATFELRGYTEVAPAIIMNEYIELAKCFYDGKEVAFVNAALDKLSKTSNNEHHEAE